MEEFTEVFVWGCDTFGQLGLGNKKNKGPYKIPRLCSFNILIRSISCGEDHSALISDTGFVYTMGSNSEGRLGIGTQGIKQSYSPCLVESLSLTKAVKIACGWGHTLVLNELGEVFAWGVGEYGALGNGSLENKWTPTSVKINELIVKDINSGSRHSAILASRDNRSTQLYMCGAGEAGQLGTGRREKEAVPVLIDFQESIKEVSCGNFQTGILTTNGEVFMMGGNSFGQLGLGSKKSCCRPEKVEQLSGVFIKKLCCSTFTAALNDRGQLYVWGSGVFGEFLLPYKVNTASAFKDISVGNGFGAAIDNCGNALSWGSNKEGALGNDSEEFTEAPQLIPGLKGKNIAQITCGGNFCIALGTDISLKKQETCKRICSSQRKARLQLTKDPINKSFDTFKSVQHTSFESTQREKSRRSKKAEPLSKEFKKFRNEAEKNSPGKPSQEKEELNRVIEELRLKTLESNEKNLIYKEQLMNFKQIIEEYKRQFKIEVRRIEEKNKLEMQAIIEKSTMNRDAVSKEDFDKIVREKDRMIIEKQELCRKVDQIKSESKEEVSGLNEKINWLERELIKIKEEKRIVGERNEIESVRKMKDEKQTMIQENLRLVKEVEVANGLYEKVCDDNAELKGRLEKVSLQNQELISMKNDFLLKNEESSFKLNCDLTSFQKENRNLVSEIAQKEIKIQDLEKKYSELLKEKITVEKSLANANIEIEIQNKAINDLKASYSHLEKIKIDLEVKFEKVLKDNKDLTAQVADIDTKNREIFGNLEKDLNQKAKDYKERTISMLSSQRSNPQLTNKLPIDESNQRSKSPYIINFAPLQEYNSNKFITGSPSDPLEKSPSLRKDTTPSKENIKAKIAYLTKLRETSQYDQ